MAEPEISIERAVLRDDFYRDSFGKLMLIIVALIGLIVLLILFSIYLFLDKPKPVSFAVNPEFRVQAPVPVNEPYLATSDVLQWVGEVMPKAFSYDFSHYDQQLKEVSRYFTADGWKRFLNQLNIYANYNTVQTNKLFVNGVPSGAPYLISETTQNLLSGRYGWWVQVPVLLNYAGVLPLSSKVLDLQVLVVRVSTLNNLHGIGIDNVIVANSNNQQ